MHGCGRSDEELALKLSLEEAGEDTRQLWPAARGKTSTTTLDRLAHEAGAEASSAWTVKNHVDAVVSGCLLA